MSRNCEIEYNKLYQINYGDAIMKLGLKVN